MRQTVRVLYIEDDEGTARLLQKRLARTGYQVDIASNGAMGLERFEAGHYEVVIVDHNMPGLSGLRVIPQLISHQTTPVVVMLTGTGSEEIAVEAMKLGAADYLVKDIDGGYLELLPTVIEQGLRQRQLLKDKQRAEEALRESEERFRILFEEAPDPYFICNLSGDLTDCNRAVELLLALNRKDLIGKNYTAVQLFAPDQLDRITDLLANITTEVSSRLSDVVMIRPDGRQIIVDVCVIPIQTKRETRILGIAHDITWRKQAEAQMQANITQLNTLRQIDDELTRGLDIDYVLSMALDSMMRLSGANAGCIKVVDGEQIQRVRSIGYPEASDELCGRRNLFEESSIMSRAARRREAEWIRDVRSDPDSAESLPGTISQIAIPLLSQDRLIGIANLETGQPDLFSSEQFEFLKLIASRVAVAVDNAQLYHTTQQQLAELQDVYTQLSRLEQLKTDMIRIAAHDLNNPLTTIMNSVYMIHKTLWNELTENQRSFIERIDGAAKQMKSISTDFLSLDRLEDTTRADRQEQEVDLVEVVQSAFAGFQFQSQQKCQAYLLHVLEAPIVARCDRAEIQEAVANLIGNAIKYTPDNGKIEVILQRDAAVIHFKVIDTGYGIPVEQQAKLFQPFFRVHMDETTSIEGTGLGLYLVKKIVERMGGEVIFHSEQGKGSTFGFTLHQ